MNGNMSKGSWRKRLASKFHKGSSGQSAPTPARKKLSPVDIPPRDSTNTSLVQANGDSTVTAQVPAVTESATSVEVEDDAPALPAQSSAAAEVQQSMEESPVLHSFWTRAYLKKKGEDPDLILVFEALAADSIAGEKAPFPGPATIAAAVHNHDREKIHLTADGLGTGAYFVPKSDQMRALVDKQMASIQDLKWKIPFAEQSIDVQKAIKNVVRAVLFAKDAITPIASLEPHASIAWAGICLVLPLLVNPEVQKEKLAEGLEVIASTLCRLTVSERLYREEFRQAHGSEPPNDVAQLMERFEMESTSLLADIIEYQARAACHVTRGPLARYMSGVVQRDNWSGTLERIIVADLSCAKLLSTLNEQKYDRNQRHLTSRLEKLDQVAAEMTEVQHLVLNKVQQGFDKMDAGISELQRLEILKALSTANYEKQKRVVPQHVVGTCRWFTENYQYRKWKEARSDVLWLAADPGCGKSVLAKYLIDEELSAGPDRITCYFFFKDGIEEQQGLERALTALLHQLFAQNRRLLSYALKAFARMGKAFASSAEQLWNILVQACSDPSAGEVIFVVDALDECQMEDRRELINRVSSLYLTQGSNEKSRAKFFMTSRPYHNINVTFQDLVDKLPNVHLSADLETAAIRKEIDVVVDHRVAQLAKSLKLKPSTQSTLAKKLKAAENRTYLWLRLIFDALEKNLASSQREIGRIVDTIPSTVYKAYASILKQCVSPEKAKLIFQIVLAAQTPLSVGELSVASAYAENLHYDEDDEEYAASDDYEPLEAHSDDIFRDKVRQICGLFVTIVDERIYFIHQTAREFLLNEGLKGHSDSQIGQPLQITECHRTLARSCMQSWMLGSRQSGGMKDGLSEYATKSWDLHAALAVLGGNEDTFDQIYESTLNICRTLCNRVAPSTPRRPDLMCVSFFGLLVILWDFCRDLSPKRKSNGSVLCRREPALQWSLQEAREMDDMPRKLSLVLRDHASDSISPQSKAINGEGEQRSYKVFWEPSYFQDLSGDKLKDDQTSSWSLYNDLFAVAISQAERVESLDDRHADFESITAKGVLRNAFCKDERFSPSIQSVNYFQLLLQRAGSGGYLHELKLGMQLYQQPRDRSSVDDGHDIASLETQDAWNLIQKGLRNNVVAGTATSLPTKIGQTTKDEQYGRRSAIWAADKADGEHYDHIYDPDHFRESGFVSTFPGDIPSINVQEA